LGALSCVNFSVDSTPPNVSIIDPAEGSVSFLDSAEVIVGNEVPTVVIGDKTIRASAFDNTSGIFDVQFFIDGSPIAIRFGPPFAVTWASGEMALGCHRIEARAHDVAGNEGVETLDVLTLPTSSTGVEATLAKLVDLAP